MSLEIIAILIIGAALAGLFAVRLIFFELDQIDKRMDRLEQRLSDRAAEPFERPSDGSLERRVAYLEGLLKGGTGKNPS